MFLFELEALPPGLRDLARSCHPRPRQSTGGRDSPALPGLAPESALRLHPCRALSSAPVSISLDTLSLLGKLVVVVHREI